MRSSVLVRDRMDCNFVVMLIHLVELALELVKRPKVAFYLNFAMKVLNLPGMHRSLLVV
uniref:Uncharacterized protein n=1 Tax=Wuchereria bancrofti TaxID=6293 RepID=A0AAF5RWQ5_WUCBA